MLRNHSKCVVPVDTFIPFRGGYDLSKWIHFHSSCTILKKNVSREGGRKASRRNLLETKKIRGRHTYGEGPLYKYIIKVVFEGQAFFSTVSFEKLKHLESAPRGEPLEPGVTYIRNPPSGLDSFSFRPPRDTPRHRHAFQTCGVHTTPANLMRLQRASRI